MSTITGSLKSAFLGKTSKKELHVTTTSIKSHISQCVTRVFKEQVGKICCFLVLTEFNGASTKLGHSGDEMTLSSHEVYWRLSH